MRKPTPDLYYKLNTFQANKGLIFTFSFDLILTLLPVPPGATHRGSEAITFDEVSFKGCLLPYLLFLFNCDSF